MSEQRSWMTCILHFRLPMMCVRQLRAPVGQAIQRIGRVLMLGILIRLLLCCVGRGGACWESLSCQVERAILVSLIWSTNTWTSIRLDDSFEVVLSIQSGTFVVAQSSMGLDDWLWMMSMKGPLGEMLDECIMESVERLVQVVKIFYPSKWNGQMIIKE